MFNFIQDIKAYLETKFSTYTELTPAKRPVVYDEYQVQHRPKLTKPEIQIYPLDDREQVNYTTFCGEKASNVPIQITVYSPAVKIGSIERSSIEASIILADKVKEFMNELKVSDLNPNILYLRRMTTSPPLPLDESGIVTMVACRYDVICQYPYVVG